jgi:hypothetical protein
MDETRTLREQVQRQHHRLGHYHVIENSVGGPHGYRDDLFRSHRCALEAAKTRAQWLAAAADCRAETLLGPAGRYLVTTGRPHDAGRMIAVEKCDDEECLEVDYQSIVES